MAPAFLKSEINDRLARVRTEMLLDAPPLVATSESEAEALVADEGHARRRQVGGHGAGPPGRDDVLRFQKCLRGPLLREAP